MTSAEILDRVKELSGGAPILGTLSCGNPAMHDPEPFFASGQREEFTFAMETQGSLPREWFANLDWLFLNIKPPLPGENVYWQKFEECIAAGEGSTIVFKLTIFDKTDYEFAKSVTNQIP